MSKVIIVVDLGHFKAYKVTKNPNESARLDLLDSYDITDTHGKLKDKFTDAEGSFARGAGKACTAKGSGEPHNLRTETEKKVIGRIASDIGSLVKKEGGATWCLAAAEKINNQILAGLDPSIKAKLDKNITADLTKTAKSKILGYFEG
ncbi:MAG: host attachment protein [Deltaproteobacteria bacterium]|nr:host attachment protein [Deltaproteobacteria bacterium]